MVKLILSVILYVLVQVLVIKDIVLFESAFCFVYILPLLLLPYDSPHLLVLIVSFFIGLLVDMFYNTIGFHAAALLIIAFLRPYWISLLSPSGGYDQGTLLSVGRMGIQWFSSYSLPLIFIFSLSLFLIEAGGFYMFGRTLLHAFSTSLLTYLTVVLSQYLFHTNS